MSAPDGTPGEPARPTARPPTTPSYGQRPGRVFGDDTEAMRGWCLQLGVDFDEAGTVYRAAVSKGLRRGRHAKGLQAAAVYVAARQTGIVTTYRLVSEVTGEAVRSLRKLAMLVSGGALPPQDLWTYVRSGAERLNLPPVDWPGVDVGEIRTDLGVPVRAGIILYAGAHVVGSTVSIDEVARVLGLNTKTLRFYVGEGGAVKPKAVEG